MKTIIEVRGGVAWVACGDAVIIDWDNITVDRASAEVALELLRGLKSKDAKRIREFIGEIRSDLA